MKKLLLLLFVLCLSTTAKSQVLISLLFGDALNSEKIEFGLVGGFNRSYILDIEDSDGLNSFNIGFYFHFKMLENSYLSTGVLVKSNVGARGMPTYPIGDEDFDNVFAYGELSKQINYFYVPLMWQQRFWKVFVLEGGFQLGLRGKAYDIFNIEAFDGDISYKTDVRDQYAHFDGGLIAGMGYKFNNTTKSMSIGMNYYYGLKNVSLVDNETIKNSSFYLYFKIPIGAGGKDKDKTKKKDKV